MRYRSFREIKAHPAGPGNPFDGCTGDTVPMPEGPDSAGPYSTLPVSYRGHKGLFSLAKPDLRMKQFGSPLLDSAGRPADSVYFFKTYAEGFGLVKIYHFDRRTQLYDSLTLIGYAKAGDSAGLVHPDAFYMPSTALRRATMEAAHPSGARTRFDPLGRRFPGPIPRRPDRH